MTTLVFVDVYVAPFCSMRDFFHSGRKNIMIISDGKKVASFIRLLSLSKLCALFLLLKSIKKYNWITLTYVHCERWTYAKKLVFIVNSHLFLYYFLWELSWYFKNLEHFFADPFYNYYFLSFWIHNIACSFKRDLKNYFRYAHANFEF